MSCGRWLCNWIVQNAVEFATALSADDGIRWQRICQKWVIAWHSVACLPPPLSIVTSHIEAYIAVTAAIVKLHTFFSFVVNERAIKWNLSCHFYTLWHPRDPQKFAFCVAHSVLPHSCIVAGHHKWIHTIVMCAVTQSLTCLRGAFNVNVYGTANRDSINGAIEANHRQKKNGDRKRETKRMHIGDIVDIKRNGPHSRSRAHSRARAHTDTHTVVKKELNENTLKLP